jgi:glycosyltransferase involved in cell wall biosynthesis
VSPFSYSGHVFVFISVFGAEGGIQSYIQDLLNAYGTLRQSNASRRVSHVFLLRDSLDCPNPLAQEKGLKFHYCHSAIPGLERFNLILKLVWLCIWQRPQHLFCGHINLSPLLHLLSRLWRIPYTVLTYGKEVWEPLPLAQRRALHQASHIWTISRYSRDLACVANQVDPRQIQLLPCGVDGRKFTPGPQSPALLDRYGLAEAKVLMTVARLWSGDPYKGVDVTIRALPLILAQEPTVKYLVIGRGDDQPRLAQLAQDLGVADRVVFAGFVPTETLVDHYRLAHAYVMPSQEGFGIVYLEAMACGVPVLSGDNDGSADPLEDSRLGWRVPHRDPEAVAYACLEMLQGQDQRCQGQWLRQQALQGFDLSTMPQRLSILLEQQ